MTIRPTLNELDVERSRWCAENGLSQLSAQDLLAHHALTSEQRDWLSDFVERWEAQWEEETTDEDEEG